MHELSVIQSIIEAAAKEVNLRGGLHTIEAIELRIGRLAGVETGTVEFLWPAAVEHSVLEHAELHIRHVPGEAVCTECARAFPIENFFDPCPDCGSHLINITAGEELQIQTLTMVENCLP